MPPRERRGLCRGHACSWRVWWSRSLEAGPCRSAGCRVVTVGTCCPTYLPRALFSCGPRANRAGVRGSFWCYQTRADASK